MSLLLKIKVSAYYKNVKILKNATEKVLEMFEIEEDDVYKIKLAISEAMVNIIKHSYGREKSEIIECEVYLNDSNTLEFLLRDFGKKVEINEIKSRELEDYQDRGLGVYLMGSVMDSVTYKHIKNGTELRMIKKII